MTAPVERYPIDFDALEKGTWIGTDELVRITGMVPEHKSWSLKVAWLCSQIKHQTGIVAHQSQNRIRLCDDAEAEEYLSRRSEVCMAGLVRSVMDRSLIDRQALTLDQRDLAERRDRYLGATVQAMRNEARQQRRIEKLVRRPVEELEAGEEV